MAALLATPAARLSEALAALAAAAEALRPLGPWGGALVAAAGVAALTVGARFARPLAVWGGAALGAMAALSLERPIQAHLGIGPRIAATIGVAAAAAGCGLFPRAFPFAAGALPGAVLGAALPLAGRASLGAAAGALAGGIVGMAAARLVTASFASVAGGVLVALGLVVAGGSRPLAREIAARPFALAAIALVLAIAGAAFQSARGPARPAPAGPLREPDPRDDEPPQRP